MTFTHKHITLLIFCLDRNYKIADISVVDRLDAEDLIKAKLFGKKPTGEVYITEFGTKAINFLSGQLAEYAAEKS